MNVDIGKVSAPETPASCRYDYVIDHVTALMTIGGIEAIEAERYSAGFGSRLHVTIAPFANVPGDIRALGVIMKDAIAQIMSVANISRVVMSPDENDMEKMMKMWNDSVKEASEANAGSAQDFSNASGAEGRED